MWAGSFPGACLPAAVHGRERNEEPRPWFLPRRATGLRQGFQTLGYVLLSGVPCPVRRSLRDYGTKEEKWHKTGAV